MMSGAGTATTISCCEFLGRSIVLGEIDRLLAAHYGFTDEELEFFSSARLRAGSSARLRTGDYDIKYRMGREAENEEE